MHPRHCAMLCHLWRHNASGSNFTRIYNKLMLKTTALASLSVLAGISMLLPGLTSAYTYTNTYHAHGGYYRPPSYYHHHHRPYPPRPQPYPYHYH